MTDCARDFAPTFGWPNVFSPTATGPAIEDVWPPLHIGLDRVPEMQRKISTCDWAAKAIQQWQAEAEIALNEPPQFAEGAAGGRCNLFTNEGHHLIFDPAACDQMWDAVSKQLIHPRPGTRGAWVVLHHERTRRLMCSLAFLWKLTGDARYSTWVWEGLRRTADLYAAAAEQRKRNPNRKSPLVYGHLYEAQAVLQIVQALELVEDAPGGKEADRAAVIEKMLTPVGEALSAWMDVMMVFNMSCWAMAALAVAGRYLGREDWVRKAFHSEQCGLRALLERGVPRHAGTGRPDGFWFEHSHFYACLYAPVPLVALYREAEHAGELTDNLREHFASLFDAPPHLADPELRILSISDRTGPGYMRLTQMRYLYEYAAGQVDSKYAPLLALLYARCGAPRVSLAAVAFGPDRLPEPQAPSNLAQSCVLPEAQLVTFRAHTSRGGATLWFNNLKRYPGTAQGHHHMDRLSISLHAFGEIITSDLGWPGTESDDSRVNLLSGTFSHNTLMLNEMDQGAIESVGFEAHLDEPVPWVRGSFRGNSMDKIQQTFRNHHRGRLEDGLYDGAILTRTLWFDFPYMILLDELDADSEKRLNFIFHARGEMVVRARPADEAAALKLPDLPDDRAWSLFGGRVSANPVSVLTADWRVRTDIFLRMISSGDGIFEATWGHSPDNPAEIRRGTVLLRAPGMRRRFATVLELHEGTPTVAGVQLSGSRVQLLRFDSPARSYEVTK